MKPLNIPFNLSILELTDEKLKTLKPVTTLDIFDNTKVNFHEEGLYSLSIFGKVGDESRFQRFSYIDIKINIFHPIIYRCLYRLKALYTDIIHSREYAIWDDDSKDFIKSNQGEGYTGFAFFLSHWQDIQYTTNDSITRIEAIKLIEKYKDKAFTNKVVVLPAGYREIEYNNDRVNENEINEYYRKILAIANVLDRENLNESNELLNRPRAALQNHFNSLYDYIESLLKGKKKLILDKWAGRRVFNSTRNVISASYTSFQHLGHPNNPDANYTQVGLYQLLKAAGPAAKYLLKNGYLSKVFPEANVPANLVNKKTLKRESVLASEDYDLYMTDEGLDKLLNLYADETLRHITLEAKDRYLGLLYLNKTDGTFKIFNDIDELPDTFSKDDVSPLTFTELLYISVYKKIEKYPALVTRYPITGFGSIYPSKVNLITTIDGNKKIYKELADDWTSYEVDEDGNDAVATSFPTRGESFLNTTSVSPNRLTKLGAD